MTTASLLSDDEIRQALSALPQWTYENNALVRSEAFPNFLRGIEFVNAVAHLAERQDHHPDLDIRYTRVTVRYWTHTAQGVTPLDVAGATETEKLVAHFKKPPALLNDTVL